MTTTHDVAALRRANPPTYETIPIGWIKLAKRNARKHSATQVDGIRTSMETSGPINPPIVDEHYRLIAGEGRYLALRKMNVTTVEVIVVRHLTDEQKRAYAIADNRLAEKSSWNWSALQLELRDLSIEAPQIDLTTIGFGHAEIEQMVSKLDQTSWSDLDQPITPPDKFAISRGGDIWLFEGDHQLACGDCTNRNLVWRLAGDEQFRLVLTDPPYNRDAKSYSGKGKHKHANFAVGHGEFDRSAFVAFLSKGFETIKAHLEDGALLQVFMDWQHIHELLDAGLEQGFSLKNILVWDKGKGGMGSLYRSGHELICLFKHGDKPHINNIQLGKNGRDRSNVLRYAGMNIFGNARDKALEMHPTSKPIQLLADLLLDVTNRGDLVFDGFGGSGSTLIAAHKLERRSRLVELSTLYCDTIIARFTRAFGSEPVLADSGESWSQVREQRLAAMATEASDGE